MTMTSPGTAVSQTPLTMNGVQPGSGDFKPKVPKTLEACRLPVVAIEELIFKLLLAKGSLSGREIAADLCLHFAIVEPILGDLKARLLLAHRSSSGMADFIYVLTDQGRDKGLMARNLCAYVGPAPVMFEDYLDSISAQSIRTEKPGVEELADAFSDLLISDKVLDTLGPAINSGRGLFLYGNAGNGKTSLAERICRCFRKDIYIPYTLWIDGQIVQLYDPQCHMAVTEEESLILQHDPRWVRVKRPVVVVGGELTMDSLELKYHPEIKVSEAPLQLKANCGVFLIDDFGRQRIHPTDLLNRWIVPLEKRIDFLALPNGKKITVPFDELIIFSTNLDPKALVDEAFLRRIPYKVHVEDPTEEEFKALFRLMCPRYGIEYDERMVEYLINRHFRGQRGFRACYPRDVLEQIVNASAYHRANPVMNEALLDNACKNYFSAMGLMNAPEP